MITDDSEAGVVVCAEAEATSNVTRTVSERSARRTNTSNTLANSLDDRERGLA
jgi:hypothetical protein